MRHLLTTLLLSSSLAISGLAFAGSSTPKVDAAPVAAVDKKAKEVVKSVDAKAAVYVAGKHYEVLPTPVRTDNANKIEVVEVFWHGCPHCHHFEEFVGPWKKQLADDVYFVRIPAIWRANMKAHAQAYFTAKMLGVEEQIHQALFERLSVKKVPLSKQKDIAKLFENAGVDKDKFDAAYNSFGIKSQVKQADARARSYRVTGTPELIVNGKFRISTKMAGSQQDMLNIADFLIKKERKAKAE